MTSPTIVIKKYGNRRLYNTFDSRYVNLDEIAALVREGKQVQVIDAKTGEDLTRVTLTQIITEDAKDKPTGICHVVSEVRLRYLSNGAGRSTEPAGRDAVCNSLARRIGKTSLELCFSDNAPRRRVGTSDFAPARGRTGESYAKELTEKNHKAPQA
jgi:polyhydroxyalkanoate synthesis repressor PhaR